MNNPHYTIPIIVPQRIITFNSLRDTIPGNVRWTSCPNCFGMDLDRALEKCPTCDGQLIVLTMIEK